MNDLLSGGRPIETVLQNQQHGCHFDELHLIQKKNAELKKQLDGNERMFDIYKSKTGLQALAIIFTKA